ncbi:MAG: tetratricopeptide repeat protein [Acidobacteria bacterium]|nr:tetratricopeptide repeat protein [Acidobacteriota bacterium]MYE43994.1 tetratricopeptide repeat protein [Acidobacteriota bacterium]
MASDTAAGARGGLWVFGPVRDLLLLVATPILILPLAFALEGRETAYTVGLLVAGFGALGHHLPGMMRAYGDRALFRRFRTRFVVSPLVFAAAALGFAADGLNGVSLIVLLWGVWHGALQVYGFLRIYDARVGATGRLTARLDWFLCIGWFAFGVLHSPGRLGELLELWYALGAPLLSPAVFFGFRDVFDLGLYALTALFVFRAGRDLLAGQGQHPVKLLAAAMSFGFWWWCSVQVPYAVLGVALFEVFHDVQYLSIVWVFNRKRARDDDAGFFTRVLFGGGRAMLFVYVGLVLGYGLFRFIPEAVSSPAVQRGVLALVAASTMLHFYFDGFIWKIRETKTSAALGIRRTSGPSPVEPGASPWLTPHAIKWAGLFFLPLALLFGLERRAAAAPLQERYENLTILVPESAEFQHNLGFAYRENGDLEAAESRYRRAIEIDPEYPRAHANLGIALLSQGDWEEAEGALRRALQLDDEYAAAHHNLGFIQERVGVRLEAERHYRRAIELDPELVEPRLGLARMLLAADNAVGAEPVLKEALAVDPGVPEANRNLGLILAGRGEHAAAAAHLDISLAAVPDDFVALETAAWILAVYPDVRDPERAVRYARRASELARHVSPSAADTLGAALAAAGDFEAALTAARTAEALAIDAGNPEFAGDIAARIALYEENRPVTLGPATR